MGKGTIVSHLGSGQYSVTLNRDRRRITTYLTWIDTRLAEIVLALVDYEASEIAAKAAFDASIVAMNDIIQQMQDHPDQYATLEPQLTAATKDSLAKQATWQGWIYALRSTRLEQTSLEKRKAALESADLADPTVSAWCADLTTNLSGVVATAEVPGERGTVQIRPGYGTGEIHSMTRDGQLQPIESGTAASAFYSWAMFPGWQKWKPTYRHGAITAIDGDTCTVTLDAALSDAQSLDINQASILTNVPIDYMECDGAAFSVGDAVLVEFVGQNWNNPKVIGFKANPQPCEADIYCMMFEKQWLATWLATPWAITAAEMFFRRYFRLNESGYPVEVTAEQAANMADIKDVWNQTLWRRWIKHDADPSFPGCEPAHKAATGRADLSADTYGQIIIKLPSGVKVSIYPAGGAFSSIDGFVSVWTSTDKGFTPQPEVRQWAAMISGMRPWWRYRATPNLWRADPTSFGGVPIQE